VRVSWSSEISGRSDLDGPPGRGRRIRFSSMTAGMHTVTVSVTDGCGGQTTADISIAVAPRVAHGRRRHDGASKRHRRDRSQ
jgi:hypothetical protein